MLCQAKSVIPDPRCGQWLKSAFCATYELRNFAVRNARDSGGGDSEPPEALNALTTQVAVDFTSALPKPPSAAPGNCPDRRRRALLPGGDLREMQRIAKNEGRLEAFL